MPARRLLDLRSYSRILFNLKSSFPILPLFHSTNHTFPSESIAKSLGLLRGVGISYSTNFSVTGSKLPILLPTCSTNHILSFLSTIIAPGLPTDTSRTSFGGVLSVGEYFHSLFVNDTVDGI